MPAIVGDDDGRTRGAGDFGDVRVVDSAPGNPVVCRRLQQRGAVAGWQVMDRDPWKHFCLKQCDSVARGDAELGRQTCGDGEELETAMPGGGRGCDTLLSDGMH